MNFLELLKKKTTWAGLGLIGFGIYEITQGDFTGVNSILIGLGMIFGRVAIGKIEKKYKE